jgi:hypothetical protein
MKAPTAQELFGPSPWVTDPAPGGVGPNGPYLYQSVYFATPGTAVIAAAIVEASCQFPKGSVKVVSIDDITPSGPFKQNQPNRMLQVPDKSLHNAGLFADNFSYGWTVEQIDKALSEEFGTPFVLVEPPAPTPAPVKPTAGLLVAPVGKIAMQMDGTYWKHVATAQG